MNWKLLLAGIIFLFGLTLGIKITSLYYKNKESIAEQRDYKAEFNKAEKYAQLLETYQNKLPELRTKVEHETIYLSGLPSECHISDDGLRNLQSAAGY